LEKWVLIVWIASQLWLPVAAYNTEDECYAAMERLEAEKQDRMSCVRGMVEQPMEKRK
jgi:hypothetical protein